MSGETKDDLDTASYRNAQSHDKAVFRGCTHCILQSNTKHQNSCQQRSAAARGSALTKQFVIQDSDHIRITELRQKRWRSADRSRATAARIVGTHSFGDGGKPAPEFKADTLGAQHRVLLLREVNLNLVIYP